MKMVKSLLLGGAAGLVAMAGAQAADLPVKAKPVQYVKICSLYGAGFYYIPGTDTCIKIGGFVRAEVNFNAGGSFSVPNDPVFNSRNGAWQEWRTRAGITVDTRSQTEFGTLRSYLILTATQDESGAIQSGTPNTIQNTGGAQPYTRQYAPAAFIQLAGFTAGRTDTFFAFDNGAYTNSTEYWLSDQGGNGVEVFAYTAQLGNGLSASISIENADAYRIGVFGNTGLSGANGYAPQSLPDLIGQLRVDQAWGGAQIMGAVHQVEAMDTVIGGVNVHPGNTYGYALGAGLKFNLPMLGNGDFIQGQLTYAHGALRYLEGNNGTPNQQAIGSGSPLGKLAYGLSYDGVVTGNTPAGAPGSIDLTKGWTLTGGYQHVWNPHWKTSLWGDYGKITYDSAASAILTAAGVSAGNVIGPQAMPALAAGQIANADWSMWQIGSRTVWTPVENLDLSLEVMYNKIEGLTPTAAAVAANPALGDNSVSWWSGIFRVQRNFWP